MIEAREFVRQAVIEKVKFHWAASPLERKTLFAAVIGTGAGRLEFRRDVQDYELHYSNIPIREYLMAEAVESLTQQIVSNLVREDLLRKGLNGGSDKP